MITEKLKRKINEIRELYALWKKEPLSTFEELEDLLKKEPILKKARNDACDMLQRDKYMFNEVCNALLSGRITRSTKLKKKQSISHIISSEDQKINEYARKVRSQLMEYLAANSKPDVPASLILTSIVIDLERLGDYTKDLAKLTLMHHFKLKGKYWNDVKSLQSHLMVMFELTGDAFGKNIKEKAEMAMNMNIELRGKTNNILLSLERDKKISSGDAVTYTLIIRYFRRVSAHLENLASSVIAPFPYLGFKRSKKLIKDKKDS